MKKMRNMFVLALSAFAMTAMVFQSQATDSTNCETSEEECVRILIGNHVYIHDGTKSNGEPEIN